MPWTILHRYVLLELLRVFALALVAITGILVMAGVVAEASQQGLGPSQIYKLVPFLIPGTLPYTVPATVLFAVSVVFGRMSADNELTAIKAAGIPITRVLIPAFLLGIALSATVYVLYREFIPSCLHRLRTTALQDIQELLYARLRRDLVFNDPKVNYSISVREVQGNRLIYPTFTKRDDHGQDEIIAQAVEAELEVDLEQRVVRVHMLHGEISKDAGQSYVIFDKQVIPVELPPIGAARRMRSREMTNAQLLARREQLLAERELLVQRIARGETAPPASRSPGESDAATSADGSEKHSSSLRLWGRRNDPRSKLPPEKQLPYIDKEIWEMETEYAMRPALSLGSFFFVLVGCPVAIWSHKRDYLSAFVTCFLPIVLGYYPMMMFSINLGKEGRLDPAYTMWVGNGVMGLVGLVMLYRLSRH